MKKRLSKLCRSLGITYEEGTRILGLYGIKTPHRANTKLSRLERTVLTIHLFFSSTIFTMKKSLFTLLTAYIVFIATLCVVCLSSCSSSSHHTAYNPMFGNDIHKPTHCAAYD